MTPQNKTINVNFNSHPLINWILGVVFASAISASLVMIAEVYFINGHFSEWKVAEIKYEIANLKFPTSYYSTNNIETQNNEDSINHIDKIESFYDRRFVTLLWTMGVLVVFTGVVLAILFAIIQYQSAKAEKTDTKNSINDEFTKLRNDFESEVKQNKEKSNQYIMLPIHKMRKIITDLQKVGLGNTKRLEEPLPQVLLSYIAQLPSQTI